MSDTKSSLCSRCNDLRLTSDSFKVRQSAKDGRRRSYDLLSGWLASGAAPIRNVISETTEATASCNLCSLIRKAIDSFGHAVEYPVTEYIIEWDLDEPYVKNSSKFTSTCRRLRVSWTRKVAITGPVQETGEMDHPVERFKYVEEEIYLLAARQLPQQPTEQSLKDAQQASATSLESNECMFRELVESGYSGDIDVVDKRLCQLPILENDEPAPYLALSYVWGKKKVLHTTSGNALSRTENRGVEKDWQEFPKTIRDALRLVQDLGKQRKTQDGENKPELRYIWIHSLCIVQDRTRSWNCSAKHMHLIYGNANFTICAADGIDSDAGLKALDLKPHEQSEYAQITPSLHVRVFKSSESLINASEWNRRGWTYQEYILSPRCLLFTGGQVYFQFRRTNLAPGDDPNQAGNGMASAWRVLLHRTYEELEIKSTDFFMTAVQTYTGRNLTLPNDILNAFSGVSQLMEHDLCSHFNFGLPASHFDLALLWKPLAGKCRRQDLEPSHGRDDVEFPSWSWCGWMDSTDHGKGAGVVYDSDFLDGCLGDIRDWLLNHTWIIWHVRNREGDVLPLWEGPTVPPSSRRMAATKWQSYKSRPRGQASCWVRHLDVPENVAVGEDVDNYGRPLKDFLPPSQFKVRLTDNPFGVRGPSRRHTRSYMFFDGHDSHSGNYMSFGEASLDRQPFQPILQFWTLSCDLWIAPDRRNPVRNHLQRLNIADIKEDKCGTVVVDNTWAENWLKGCVDKNEYPPIQFIALSEAKCFTEEEWCGNWTNYNGRIREDTDWSLFYVMAITRDERRGVWERLGLGKVFQPAFRNNGCTWEEIVLG
ncbi:Heterokaryon incompatibility protein (HET) domain containing protein [Rhypophila sp. PSN 637]